LSTFERQCRRMTSRHQATTPIAVEMLDSLPVAVDPLALSLNENPFPPLPAVRSALIASIDAANRYPEFLPERLRSLIAGRIVVPDEQVVLGAGASGVVMQALHAVTGSCSPPRPSMAIRSSPRWPS